jgi:hypothetical protein
MNALEEAEAARRALDGVMIMGRVMKWVTNKDFLVLFYL